MLSYEEDFKREYYADFKKKQKQINKILDFIHLDTQKIENGQLILFMVGIIFIVLGLFLRV